MANYNISGFSDEISANTTEQFEALNRLGISYFEPRGIDGTNISSLTDEEAYALKAKMDSYGIKASSIGSPIGKIKIEADFEPHFELFKRTVKIAKILDTKYIRMFSFYVTGEWTEEKKAEVYARLNAFIDYAKENDIVLLHENEKGIYGDIGTRCAELMQNLYCDNFKAVFDPANFVQCGEDTKVCFDALKPYVEYMHIKDAITESGKVVPAGKGDGNLRYITKSLLDGGYAGFFSLEPHLGSFEGLADLEEDDKMLDLEESGEGKFTLAYRCFNDVLSACENDK